MEEITRNLFETFIRHTNRSAETFKGISDEEVEILEDLFNLNIVMYSAELKGNRVVGLINRRSLSKFHETAYLLQWDDHVCYITKLSALFNLYRCTHCQKFFRYNSKLIVHERTCEKKTKHEFPTGVYQLELSIFERLQAFDIHVPHELRFYEHAVVYDWEAILNPIDPSSQTNKLQYIRQHIYSVLEFSNWFIL